MTRGGPIIPQASSLPRLIAIIEQMSDDEVTVASLAETFSLWPRTIAFYIEAARWLDLVDPHDMVLTEAGELFADSIEARSRLFVAGLTRHRIIREIMGAHRSGDPLRAAAVRIIGKHTALANSTVERRASGVAGWLEIALKPSDVDWETGQPAPHATATGLGIEGRSFVTSLAASVFGSRPQLSMTFPRDLALLLDHPDAQRQTLQTSATYRPSKRGHTHYAGIPVTTAVLELWRKHPYDFRKVVIAYCPYVCLATLLLWQADRRAHSAAGWFVLTDDLWGICFWRGGVPIGSLLDVVEELGRALDVTVVQPRHTHRGHDRLLLDILLHLKIIRRRDTRMVLSQRFLSSAQREGRADGQWGKPFAELVRPARELVDQWQRNHRAGS